MAEFENMLLAYYQDYGVMWYPNEDGPSVLRTGAGTERDCSPFLDESSQRKFVSTNPKGISLCDDSAQKTMANNSEGSYRPNVHDGPGGEK